MDHPPTLQRPLASAHLADWRAFLQAHALLSRRLDDELRAEHSMSLAEYDALVQLAESPDHQLRMSELADRVLLSRSGVTRLVDRLETGGLVTRVACATDARGATATLTPVGLARLRRAAVTHLRGVDRYFLGPLPSDDLCTIGRALASVVDGIVGHEGAAGTRNLGCPPGASPNDGPPDDPRSPARP